MRMMETLKKEPIAILGGTMIALLVGEYYWKQLSYGFLFLYLGWSALGIIGILIKPVAVNQTLYKLITPVDQTPATWKDLAKNKDFWIVLVMLFVVPYVALLLTRSREYAWGLFIVFPYICGMLSVCFRKVRILHIFIILAALFILLETYYHRYPVDYDIIYFQWNFVSILLVMHSLSHILDKIQPSEFTNILVLCVIHVIAYVFLWQLLTSAIPMLNFRSTTIAYLIMVLINVLIDIRLKRRA